MIKKPIHKLNGGNGATLCVECSVVICTGLKDILYCDKCKKKDMTPQEKAKELVDKYFKKSDLLYEDLTWIQAKECALIAVDEMIVQNGELYLNQLGEKALQFYIKNNHFLFEVKKEIEKL